MEVQCHAFLILALDGGVWSASCPGTFIPRERAPGTPWIGGRVGLRACMDMLTNRKVSVPAVNEPWSSSL